MTPTVEELQLGAMAYERVRLYEAYGAKNLKQLPWVLGVVFVALLIVMFFTHPTHGHSDAGFGFVFLPVCMTIGWVQATTAKKLYASNKMLLRLLEEKYGEALPWVQEQKILAASRELEATSRQAQHVA